MLGDIARAEEIYIVCGYSDMRKSIDGFAAIIKGTFGMDPFSPSLFLFCGRRRDRLNDGRIELSNNRAENAIRPYVTGRKNWLFADTTRGAKASAIVYSMIESAKANQLNPYMYLVYLLTKLPGLKELNQESLEPFLPWSPELLSWCRNNSYNAPQD